MLAILPEELFNVPDSYAAVQELGLPVLDEDLTLLAD